MTMMWPLNVEGKPLAVASHLAEWEGFVQEAAGTGLPAHEVDLWGVRLGTGGVWTRAGQRIEAVPLDACLGLPEGPFTYRLRDWDQALAADKGP